MKPFLVRWLCTTVAVAVASKLGFITVETFGALVGMALFLGILNALVRPVILLLAAPFIVVTLGFFILLINTAMFALASSLPGVHVNGFGNAFFGALIVSFVSWSLSLFFRGKGGQYHLITHHSEMKRVEGRVVGE